MQARSAGTVEAEGSEEDEPESVEEAVLDPLHHIEQAMAAPVEELRSIRFPLGRHRVSFVVLSSFAIVADAAASNRPRDGWAQGRPRPLGL